MLKLFLQMSRMPIPYQPRKQAADKTTSASR